ncbi:MAG TPA: hypothetical protein VIV54_20590 [Burkholderiales bacterium]
METIFNGLWLIGAAASFLLVAYGGLLAIGYNRHASLRVLEAAAFLALSDSLQRGASLAASKQAATAN